MEFWILLNQLAFLKNRDFKILIAGDGSERDSIVVELKRSE